MIIVLAAFPGFSEPVITGGADYASSVLKGMLLDKKSIHRVQILLTNNVPVNLEGRERKCVHIMKHSPSC